MSDERVGQLYMLLAMTISGTIGFFVLSSGQSPFNVVLFRCAIGSVGLAAYCLCRGYFSSFRLSGKEFVNLFFGALTLIANWCFLFTAYRLTSVGITTVVYNVQPFLLVIAGFLVRSERPSRTAVFWLVLSFSGLVVLAQPGAQHNDGSYLPGILSALAAATLYAATTLLTRSLSQSLRPELIAVGHMVIGTAVFIPLANFHELPASHSQIGAIVALGMIHTTFMYILLYGAFKKAATSSIAVLSFIYPLVAVTVDFFAYGRMLSFTQLGGGLLIVTSAVAYSAGLNPLAALARIASRAEKGSPRSS
ncbi:DMT family transporter [Paraburkholderia azotifigens]|uniref:DMT family transporter n=1 Tax=Paraburkholderia azotifigens TaxID=2057004 RepID=A0A5C6VS62_9BURK|nr:DMT family transporter [Paraburkholderia azotifigens]TXC87436.1 EamA family transporter [Paraburkholderia azotifigens]